MGYKTIGEFEINNYNFNNPIDLMTGVNSTI